VGWNYNVASPLCLHGLTFTSIINETPHYAFFFSLPLKTKPTGCKKLKRMPTTLVYLPVACCYLPVAWCYLICGVVLSSSGVVLFYMWRKSDRRLASSKRGLEWRQHVELRSLRVPLFLPPRKSRVAKRFLLWVRPYFLPLYKNWWREPQNPLCQNRVVAPYWNLELPHLVAQTITSDREA
jgi:hypothetical protein